jgi:hypothetical protein
MLCLLHLVALGPARGYVYGLFTRLQPSAAIVAAVFVYELFTKLRPGATIVVAVFAWLHVMNQGASLGSISVIGLLVASILLVLTTSVQVGWMLYHTVVPNRQLPSARVFKWHPPGKDSEPPKPFKPFKVRLRLPRSWDVRAGQTIFLYAGVAGFWTQAHPFSIAWWSEPGKLLEKKSVPGRLTLGDLALPDQDTWNIAQEKVRHPEYEDGDEEDDVGEPDSFLVWLLLDPKAGVTRDLGSFGPSREFLIAVDGPYGGHRNLRAYGHVVMFAQGIGIAAHMSYIRTLLYGSIRGELPTRRISLVWEVEREGEMFPPPHV